MDLICDITNKLPSLVKLEAYCPFLIFHVGTTLDVIRILRNIKRKDAEGIRSKSGVLLSPPSQRLGPTEEAAYGSSE